MKHKRDLRERRRGFVLLAVLTVLTGCLAIGTLAVAATRLSLRETQNRNAFHRAMWFAEECAERARAALYESSSEMPSPVSEWSRFDEIVRQSRDVILAKSCAVTLAATGDRLDITRIDERLLRSVLQTLGRPPTAVDSLADALLDWQDLDTIARQFGAEARWYVSQLRPPPRNGPLADIKELRLVRGFERAADFDSLVGVESGRLSLTHTPWAVLAAVPGIGPEVANAIVQRRHRGAMTRTINELFGEVSAASRVAYLNNQEELVARITVEPDGWVLTSRASAAGSRVAAVLELKLARAGSSSVVVRRRATWG